MNASSSRSFSDEMPLSTADGLIKNAVITITVSRAPNAKTIGPISARNSSNSPDSEPLIL